MTIWDKIHKSGKSWGSLSEDIHPLFKEFLEQSKFKIKYVLDIGCGGGKYLKFLQDYGFKVEGIDSSKTAIEKSKKLLGKSSNLKCKDMFNFKFPQNKYDLVISISTIHHGTKRKIQTLVNSIHKTLISEGKIFITIPSIISSKEWNTFKDSEEVGTGIFRPLKGPEKGLTHSFYTKTEVKKLFSKFKNLKLNLDDHSRWVITAKKQ